MADKKPHSPLKPSEIPSLGLFYTDLESPAFVKSSKIDRTPVKGSKPPSTQQAKLDKDRLQSHEEIRLQRENARLIDMVETLITQISNQVQIESLNPNIIALTNPIQDKAASNPALSPSTPDHSNNRRRVTSFTPSTSSTAAHMDTALSITPPDNQIFLLYRHWRILRCLLCRLTSEQRQKARWTRVSGAISKLGFSFSKAINTKDGVKFFPITSYDYRGITKFLSENGEECHTFMLQEEKTVQVVIRGLPLEIPISDVEQDLKDHNYHPNYHRGQLKTEMPLVVVKVPPEEDRIFGLSYLLRIKVKVEPLERKNIITQCYRCQKYGHAQTKCSAFPRCVKCAGGHHSWE
ncbi:unnamed protein product [Brassicogethes aeneus]|uniref:CCHC-type domain-containing protein n=1 Tax=Brassicogethes aeneus TaxID=1431903 RepID=A0A9P0AYE6_BRAAE|nr:unnamed protein product [Brassicogethes aeneus]